MSGPRVSFSGKIVGVPAPVTKPVVPTAAVQDDGSIFVSIASYRDGERCGATLQSIFENALHPEKVIVGVVEQNDPEDAMCVEEYCKKYGVDAVKRQQIRQGVTKILTRADEGSHHCPHHDQIRLLAVQNVQAKGPSFARSLTHKVLGNQDYCLQMDAHTTLVKDWDAHMVSEWQATQNEFAVLSSLPPPVAEMEAWQPGGTRQDQIPRQCKVKFQSNGIPDYEGAEEKTLAMSLTEPLLSHSWSAAYSFSKCHLEESVPYDPFSYYAMPVEQFVRYARMWTRGYDTYTPTRNYLFHDYGDQENGHGDNEWFHHMKNRFRMMAIRRSQKVLNVLDEALPESNLANLGLYGLGKRRSLKQLEDFTKMNFSRKRGNEGKTEVCVHEDYVPYDAAISPVENLYDEPANLDPQPEYPLRTNLIFAQQPKHESIAEQHWAQASLGEIDLSAVAAGGAAAIEAAAPLSNLPSPFLLALLWIFGLMVWCLLFLKNSTSPTVLPTHRRKTKGPASKRVYKDV